jgi:hypothetical protein
MSDEAVAFIFYPGGLVLLPISRILSPLRTFKKILDSLGGDFNHKSYTC